MQSLPNVFTKLAAHFKSIQALVGDRRSRYFDPRVVLPIFRKVEELVSELRAQLPELYADVAPRELPSSSGTTDYDGRGYIQREALDDILRDLDYVFEVRAGSQVALVQPATLPRRVFISHGRTSIWREVQAYLDRDVQVSTLELAQEPNRGRTVLQKLTEESDRCSYAVVVMTGDDQFGDDPPRARENVMHEIGFFQGKYGLNRVTLLYEEGTSIPSNIHGLVYIPFPKDLVSAALVTLRRELDDAFQSSRH